MAIRQENLHALHVELVTTRQAHDLADTIDVFLQANDALNLPAHVFLPLARHVAGSLLVFCAGRGSWVLQRGVNA